ncbi:hypothetical protein [Lentzea albidocapillata]|uniref:Uncharacterized protein n=1 Tax=Lentzea albidocapillata TaxID=40571 RepID=A0A1W2CXH0_9PSEU|nr:hypothetical protein [Lentzea albidocapillata]SMC89921.1 hypothetical protein SAMN05660733_02486 [Lentzea albidocapillata]
MRTLSRLLVGLFSVLFLAGFSTVPASAAETARAETSVTIQALCHPCNGFRYQNPGSKAVYVVIDGLRHYVPDPTTYFNLWGGWDGLRPDGSTITIGDSLIHGAFLAKEVETGKVYLVGRTKRWIPSPTVFNQYAFDPSKIRSMSRASLPAAGPNIPGR